VPSCRSIDRTGAGRGEGFWLLAVSVRWDGDGFCDVKLIYFVLYSGGGIGVTKNLKIAAFARHVGDFASDPAAISCARAAFDSVAL
jgi:hypothetical protein